MKRELIGENPVLKHTYNFSLKIVTYCAKLDADKKFVISRQLLRSATSIGANSMEAQNAESLADFIHKFKIAAKEAEETQYWLTLCENSEQYPKAGELLIALEEIQKIINSILSKAYATGRDKSK